MPTYVSDTVGNIDDRVRLVLGQDEVVIAEQWDVNESVLSQPSAWSLTLGWGGVSAGLLAKYPPNTQFKLYVGNTLQSTGWTDARGVTQPENGGTTVHFKGRDALAPLESSDINVQVSFNNPTYPEIVWRALQAVNIAPPTALSLVASPDGNGQVSTAQRGGVPILRTSNAANRSVKAGVKIAETQPVITVDEYLALPTGVIGVQRVELQGKVSESWHRFTRRYLDRAGLFLWAAADGSFVLSQPNGRQKSAYSLVRRRKGNTSNVLAMSFNEDATRRHSDYTIYARGGGAKHGPVKSKGAFTDVEMVNVYGLDRPGCIRDATVQSAAEAAYLARRKLCEERRSGWTLSYVISGHTLPVSASTGSPRATVVPDTVVHVDDEEIGIVGDFYVETVRKRRGPATTTEIHLMRPEDLFFGGPDS